MIALAGLAKHYGQRTLFQDVSLTLNAGRCYGLVGANGSGKSTLLRIIAGEETPSAGNVGMPRRARLGMLRQDHFLSDAQPIIEVAMMGDRDVFDAIMEKDRLLVDESGDFDHDRFHALEEIIAARDGYSLESRAGAILEGLGIPTPFHRQPLSTLSGGFKLRVLMAQALAAEPDILLLDEPTNHLDIISIRWLEKFLNTFNGLAMVVSHDHRFLDNACTDILDVDYESVIHYPGNYTFFKEGKVADRDRKEAEIEKKQKEIEHHQAYIDRFRYKATKARQAQSKMKLLERVIIDPLARSSRAHPNFKFRQRRPSGREVIKVEGVGKSYGPKRVLDGVGLTVMRGDRLAVIGPNGIGKSTLLKVMMGELAPDQGGVTWGYEAHPGYFAQDQKFTGATPQATVQSWLWDTCPGEPIGFVRGQLGLVLFSGDDAEKRVASLSGGEAARLTFARLAVEKPNVLVLDEPTNHLDLEAIESLVEGLKAYDGSVIFVSHDRWFVSELATRILEITPQGVNDFPGTYEEYLAKAGDDHLDANAAAARARNQKDAEAVAAVASASGKGGAPGSGKGGASGARTSTPPTPGSAPAASRQAGGGRTDRNAGASAATPAPAKDDRQRQKRRAELSRQSERIAADLQAAEARVGAIDKVYCAPGFFEATPREEVRRLDMERESLRRRVDELMADWERLEKELASA